MVKSLMTFWPFESAKWKAVMLVVLRARLVQESGPWDYPACYSEGGCKLGYSVLRGKGIKNEGVLPCGHGCTLQLVSFPNHFCHPGKIGLVNGLFCFHSLQLQKLWHNVCRNVIYDIISSVELLWHTITPSWDISLQRWSSSEVSITKKRRSWKEKHPFIDREYWSNLIGIHTFHCRLSSFQAHPDHSWNSWRPSRDLVSVLHSLVSWILPRSLSFLGFHYSHYYVTQSDWPTNVLAYGMRTE